MIAPDATLPPGRAIALLLRLRLRRLVNVLTNARLRPPPKGEAAIASRPATPAKRRLGAVLSLTLGALMLVSLSFVFFQSMLNVHCHLTPGSACAALIEQGQQGARQAVQIAPADIAQHGISPEVARTVAVQLALMMANVLLILLGLEQLHAEDWDMEWLATLPMGRRALLLARILERSVADLAGLLATTIMCLPFAVLAGWRWGALPLALGVALALQPFSAVLRTLVDTGLRVTLTPARLRNLLSLAGIAAVPFMFAAAGPGMGFSPSAYWDAARALPAWVMWTPPGLALGVILAPTLAAGLAAAGLLLAQAVLATALGVLLVGWQLRDGIVRSGVRESARRPRAAAPTGKASGLALPGWLTLRSPVQRRELKLLARDRQFFMQSIVTPLLICGMQLFLRPGGAASPWFGPQADPRMLATAAFVVGAYMLMMSALQTLNSEGKALWMLYGFPQPIERVLRDKAQLWAALALVFPVIVFGTGIALGTPFGWHMLYLMSVVALGVPLYAVIAVALGVFACDPLSPNARNKMRPSYVYLYLLLMSMYGYTMFAEHWWQVAIVIVLCAGLAQALWQKARDALPYLLDPAAAPPSRVSTADGIIAVLAFFTLQTAVFLTLTKGFGMEMGRALALAFAAGGIVVYGLARLVFWKFKTAGVPQLLPPDMGAALRTALGAGGVAIVAGIGWLTLVHAMPWGRELIGTSPMPQMAPALWFALAVLAAPLCEEFLFRGLLFGGLRRSMGFVPAALLSAGLFAIVHPPVSMPAVFIVGLCTAWAYERSKGLLAPMLVHAVYNAAILAFQLL